MGSGNPISGASNERTRRTDPPLMVSDSTPTSSCGVQRNTITDAATAANKLTKTAAVALKELRAELTEEGSAVFKKGLQGPLTTTAF